MRSTDRPTISAFNKSSPISIDKHGFYPKYIMNNVMLL